ncbi:hypothetical protein WMY93_018697 [Mugilogobius chulae]|uniref:Uncharacterized protein n=1 Tax=Mugilogobius chulae TaxID=88201 RepID=A0AAW0NMF1_9GOBI
MSEASEQSHHLKTPGSPSGGSSSGDPVVEHPPSCKQKSAASPSATIGDAKETGNSSSSVRTGISTQTSYGNPNRGGCAQTSSPQSATRNLTGTTTTSTTSSNNTTRIMEKGTSRWTRTRGWSLARARSGTGVAPPERSATGSPILNFPGTRRKPWTRERLPERPGSERRCLQRDSRLRPTTPPISYGRARPRGARSKHGERGRAQTVRVGVGLEDTGSEEDFLDNTNNNEEEDEEEEGSDGIGRPGNAGGEFLQRDFSETYEMYHVESLQNMTKQELVKEYLELEKCMSRLEEENNRLRMAMEPRRAACPASGSWRRNWRDSRPKTASFSCRTSPRPSEHVT